MIRVLIADDEPKIRRGLAHAIDWETLSMEVCGFAKNGVDAIEIAERMKPHICLIDICMPLISGLDLINQLHEMNPNTICIVITGYDEFSYAQKAIQLGVFDYILKPVNEEQLLATVQRARDEVKKQEDKKERQQKAEQMLIKNLPFLRDRFLNELCRGNLTEEEMAEHFKLHDIVLENRIAVFCVQAQDKAADYRTKEWDRQLLQFVLRNICEEIASSYGSVYASFNDYGNLIGIIDCYEKDGCKNLETDLLYAIQMYMGMEVSVLTKEVDTVKDIPALFAQWEEEKKQNLSPLTKHVKKYIESNYSNYDISIQEAARECNSSVSYASRTFKQEMGLNSIEYLTKVRMQEALILLDNTDLRIYEIADKVGYKSQHYFCVAFKKVLGLSPTEYKQRKEEA